MIYSIDHCSDQRNHATIIYYALHTMIYVVNCIILYNIYLHVLIMRYNSMELYLCVPAVKVF